MRKNLRLFLCFLHGRNFTVVAEVEVYTNVTTVTIATSITVSCHRCHTTLSSQHCYYHCCPSAVATSTITLLSAHFYLTAVGFLLCRLTDPLPLNLLSDLDKKYCVKFCLILFSLIQCFKSSAKMATMKILDHPSKMPSSMYM